MSATDQASSSGSPLVLELLATVAERAAPGRAEAMAGFARAYTRRVGDDAFAGRTVEELFAEIAGAFDLADHRGAADVAVRAINPTLASHGYTTVGTVVETNTLDSPFLVDSVTAAIGTHGLDVRQVIHPVIGTVRAADGTIARVLHAREADVRESVMHFEADRRIADDELGALAETIRRVLGDVRRAVRDFGPMRERIPHVVEIASHAGTRYSEEDVAEAQAFLGWLLDQHFVFLGYREYRIVDVGGTPGLAVEPGTGLGILDDPARSTYSAPVPLDRVAPELRDRILAGDLLTVAKTNRPSTVHRPVRMDYVGVKMVDADGRITGEARFLGLFTAKAYSAAASKIPVLHAKLEHVLRSEDLFEGSHDYKMAVALFESFPKDELFAAAAEDLRKAVVTLLDLQEREHIRLLVRQDIEEQTVSFLVSLPRDRFNADLRKRLQALFGDRLGTTQVDAHLSLGQGDRVQIHYLAHCDGPIPSFSPADLEREVVALARTWDDRLLERLVQAHGEARGRELAVRYAARFPDYYKSATDVATALLDVERFEELAGSASGFVVGLHNERGTGEMLTRVGLYRRGAKIALSEFVPILESLGLRVVEEIPTRLSLVEEETFLHDFGVLGQDGRPLDLDEVGSRVADCIGAVWRGEAELDSLNRLVVTGGLTWRQVAILRAYRKYRQRVSPAFTEEYQNDAFAAHPGIAAGLVRYFELRFDPAADADGAAEEAQRQALLADLDAVRSLDEDRILRGHLGCMAATVRTNAYLDRAWLSFKLRSADVPEMPKPYPLFEIFVYSPEMEGIHLRGGRVARGGIRWSDRREDYRTEVLGLMKAQMVKNAVIVPVGSKGGFVLKRHVEGRDAVRAEVERQYRVLIRGMLDVTDNLVGGAVVHPVGVRIHDDPDPYLVVAADKGTATLSDVANDVSAEYGFWLGDAFASGGSKGYDHKALGITAKGAWESVKRHFRELGLDTQAEPFTVVGVGDMSGDVFGNGMQLSPCIRLVAAFDHRHVFLDPDPDPASSLAERQRLFALPASSWDDYDRSLISAGGGVFSRAEKSIALTPEVRTALGIDATALAPTELIRAILRAPVDLLWNGGIGTYVKAADETHSDVGDRANDAVRVDGATLRCRVVGEGGNLGFTQRGRIEYARHGGRINTDAVDNSAGVDCSDHEVNLKILLGLATSAGDLTGKQRDLLLEEVTDDVEAHVLYDNYQQAQILSQVEGQMEARGLEPFEDLMVGLEAEGMLERPIEFLPSTEEMAERSRNGVGMARPELCVLMAYAKRSLKDALLRSDVPDDPHLEAELLRYFPPRIVERFGELIPQHPLRRELVAMIVANEVVNAQGITFTSRFTTETGASPADVVRAFWIARDVTGATPRWSSIEALDGRLDPTVQVELMNGADEVVEGVARWYLVNAPGVGLGEAIGAAREGLAQLEEVLPSIGTVAWRGVHEEIVSRLVDLGVDEQLARRHAFQPELVHGPDIIGVATATDRPIEDVARAFYQLGERLHVDWLEQRLDDLPATSRWRRWATLALADDLLAVRRDAVRHAIATAPDADVAEAVERWLALRASGLERLDRLMHTVALEGISDIAVMTVALRQVRALIG